MFLVRCNKCKAEMSNKGNYYLVDFIPCWDQHRSYEQQTGPTHLCLECATLMHGAIGATAPLPQKPIEVNSDGR